MLLFDDLVSDSGWTYEVINAGKSRFTFLDRSVMRRFLLCEHVVDGIRLALGAVRSLDEN